MHTLRPEGPGRSEPSAELHPACPRAHLPATASVRCPSRRREMPGDRSCRRVTIDMRYSDFKAIQNRLQRHRIESAGFQRDRELACECDRPCDNHAPCYWLLIHVLSWWRSGRRSRPVEQRAARQKMSPRYRGSVFGPAACSMRKLPGYWDRVWVRSCQVAQLLGNPLTQAGLTSSSVHERWPPRHGAAAVRLLGALLA